MSAPSRELEDRIGWFPPLVRELVLRYVEENPEAANDPRLVAHALRFAEVRRISKTFGTSDLVGHSLNACCRRARIGVGPTYRRRNANFCLRLFAASAS